MDPITFGAAVGWGISALGWVASPLISRLLNQGFDYLGYDTSKKLRKLEPKVLLLERVMEGVEKNRDRSRLEHLFKDLKSALYEAEDILDDMEYYRLEKQIQDDKLQSDGGMPTPNRDRMKVLSAVAKYNPLKIEKSGISNKKLRKSIKKVERIIKEAHQILEQLNLPNLSDGNRRQTITANSRTTSAPPQEVIGRDDDRDKIIAMLHEKEDSSQPSTSAGLCYSVIGIHGIGGSGKSTLAQFVCAQEKENKKQKNEGHFDLVMWVHISRNFSVDAIFKELYEAATEPKVQCPQFNSLDVLREELQKKIYGKRFLLVLDDVWCNNDTVDQDLPELLSPLKVGKGGSKIIVTTRNKEALSDLGPGMRCTSIPMQDLDGDVFFELFMHYALADGPDRDTLKTIGAEIALKLKGSPLAARIVGGQLRKRQNTVYWRSICDQNLLNGTMGALWWSYRHLGEEVRRCFAYCSIFPQRHRLDRDELVNLWVAEGFIRSRNEGEDMEHVGREYFDELVSTSFLQLGAGWAQYGNDGRKAYYLVHDLLHDIAEMVDGSDCFRIENGSWTEDQRSDWGGDIPRDVRHLFIHSYDGRLITEKILHLENLRTLIIYTVGSRTPVEEQVIEGIFKRLPKLRVLAVALSRESLALINKFSVPDSIAGREPTTVFSVPESIGQLKHLRYLAFRTGWSCSVVLPSTLTKLYHMQLLDFGHCKEIKFPSADLVNLRHVLCSTDPLPLLPNIGRLTSLQAMRQFRVKKEQGYEVKQLRHLNKLRNSLDIHGLENIESKEEALEANLAAKEWLTHLSLYWDGDTICNPEVQAEVLESLCPPVKLQALQIFHYRGLRYPDWMVGRQSGGPKDLQHISLDGWSQAGPAPELEAFVHLHSIVFSDCCWDALPGSMEHLTSLKELTICNCKCSGVRSLPTLPQSLEKFRLVSGNDELMNWRKISVVLRLWTSMCALRSCYSSYSNIMCCLIMPPFFLD